MLILAIDTSGAPFGVCLLDAGRVRAETSVRMASVADIQHIALLDRFMQNAGVDLGEVGAVACAIGPGSFTGLRVGLSLAKGLTADARRPLFGISTLAAMARSAGPSEQLLVPCLDARRKQVYAAGFKGGREVLPEAIYEVAELAASVAALGQSAVWMGEGAAVYRDLLAGPSTSFGGALLEFPRAAAIGELAWEAWQRGERPASVHLVPNYLRAPEAERNLRRPPEKR